MTSQLVIFRAFLFIFSVPPTLGLKKKSRKSTNKKNLALNTNQNNPKILMEILQHLTGHVMTFADTSSLNLQMGWIRSDTISATIWIQTVWYF